MLVWPATLLYWHAKDIGGFDIIGGTATLIGVPPWVVAWAYPALNVMLVGYIVYSWVELPNVLERARAHFRRIRGRISDDSDVVLLDEVKAPETQSTVDPSWRATWAGRRDGNVVTIEVAERIASRNGALHWAHLRTRRVYMRDQGPGEFQPARESRTARIIGRLLRRKPASIDQIDQLLGTMTPPLGVNT